MYRVVINVVYFTSVSIFFSPQIQNEQNTYIYHTWHLCYILFSYKLLLRQCDQCFNEDRIDGRYRLP